MTVRESGSVDYETDTFSDSDYSDGNWMYGL